MALYKKAGARYFVSMGVHHDDFFLWNSKIHRWNAVKMGPHRDVVGDQREAGGDTRAAARDADRRQRGGLCGDDAHALQDGACA